MRQGGLRDAILHSVGANATHGLRRTNADKRRAVTILLGEELVSTDPETGAPWSNREIARRCAVSADMVDRLRPVICPKRADAPRTVERGGSVYEMKPRASAKPVEPAPSAPAEAEAAEALPELEAEPALPFDAPPSNVVRAGDRFSLVPAPAAIELDALADEAAQWLGGSFLAVAILGSFVRCQKPVRYPGQHFPRDLASGLEGLVHLRFRVLAAHFGEQLTRQPVEFLVR